MGASTLSWASVNPLLRSADRGRDVPHPLPSRGLGTGGSVGREGINPNPFPPGGSVDSSTGNTDPPQVKALQEEVHAFRRQRGRDAVDAGAAQAEALRQLSRAPPAVAEAPLAKDAGLGKDTGPGDKAKGVVEMVGGMRAGWRLPGLF
jgi:hypothetical protein